MTVRNQFKRRQKILSRRSPSVRRALIEACEPRLLLSSTWSFSKIADITSTTGGITNPGGLVMDPRGDLFGYVGRTAGGANKGYIFEVAAGSNYVLTLALFTTDAWNPVGNLVLDSSGNIYGIFSNGGGGGGLFECTVGNPGLTVLGSFSYSGIGTNPVPSLAIDSNGNLYGATKQSAANTYGGIFEYSARTSSLIALAPFNIDTGSSPTSLILQPSGLIDGTVSAGMNSPGLFSTDVLGDPITSLAAFDPGAIGYTPGTLIACDSSGNLYGTTQHNLAGTGGCVYEYTQGSGVTELVALGGIDTNGAAKVNGVVADSLGDLFGTISTGTSGLDGSVFEVTGGSLTTLVNLNSTTGYNFSGGLVVDNFGDLYGLTSAGGANGYGTIFELIPSATNAVVTSQPTSATAGTSQSISVSLENTDGIVDSTNGATVTLSIASEPNGATIGGTLTATAVNGVATFSGLTFSTAGDYTLTASSSGLVSGQTATITVSGSTSPDVWTGNVDSNWSNPGNWEADTVPASGDSIEFPASSATLQVNLDSDVTVDNLTFDAPYQLNNQTITISGDIVSNVSGDSIASTLNFPQATNINAGTADDLTVDSITGSGNLTAPGEGTLVLANGGDDSGYSGTIEAQAGTLEVDTTLGASVTVDTGATVDGSGTVNGITTSGGTVSVALQGSSALIVNADSTIDVPLNATLSYSNIFGSYNLTKTGLGTLIFADGGSIGNAFTDTTVSSGTLEVDTALASGVTVDGGATLDGTGTVNGIIGNGGIISVAPQANTGLILEANSTINVSSSNTLTFNNIGGSYNLTKTGAGTLIFADGGSIGNAYTSTTVSSGTLEVDTALASGVTVDVGATLDGTGTVNGIIGAGGTISVAPQSNSGLTVVAASTINIAGGSTLSFNSITGIFFSNLTLTGGGTLVYANGGSFSNFINTIVSSGTLEVDTALGSSVTVRTGATVDGTGTVNGITAAGGTISVAPQPGSGLTVASASTIDVADGNTLSFDNTTGLYNLTKTGAGTLVFAGGGNLSYFINTTVSEGVLEVDTQLEASVTVETGATLDGTGTVNGITGAGGTISIAAESGSTLTLDADTTINVASGHTFSFNNISGSYNLTKTGPGTLVYAGGGSIAIGSSTVSSGTLEVDITLTSGATVFTGATIDGTGTVNGISGAGGAISVAVQDGSTLTLNSNTTINVPSAHTLSFNNITGSYNLTKTGAGTLVYTSGGAIGNAGTSTTVSSGTLEVDTQLISGVTVNTGATVDGSGTVDGITGAGGTVSVVARSGSNFSLNADTTINVGFAATLSFGRIIGSYNITKTGGGTLVYPSGATIGIGGTTVSSGTLEVDMTLGSSVTVDAGAAVDGSGTANGITGAGGTISIAPQVNSALILNSNSTIEVDNGNTLSCGSIDGSYNLTKTGTGTLVLPHGADLTSYGGSIAVSAGTLEVDTTLGAGVTVDVGATLDGTGTANGITGAGGTISIAAHANSGLTLIANSTINVASNSTLTFNRISGSFDLAKAGTGTLVLADGGNLASYQGNIHVNSGTLEVDTQMPGNLLGNGGTLSLGDGVTANVILQTDTTINVNSSDNAILGSLTGSYNLTKTGTGTLVLSGNNIAFGLSATVSAGTLEVDTALTSAVTVDTGATVDGTGSADGITAAGGTVSLASADGLMVSANSTIFVDNSATLSFGAILGSSNLTKAGSGTLVLSLGGSFGSYTGYITVGGGTLDVEGNLIEPVILDASTTLDGSGIVAGIIDNSGTVALSSGASPAQLDSSGDLSFTGGTLAEVVSSEDSGELVATGSSIDLSGATLALSLLNGYAPSPGTVITVISNQTGSPITGTFSGLAQGAVTNLGGVNVQISYTVGLSHDVTLTVVPDVWTGATNDGNWNTAGNWQSGVVPASGDSIVFPADSGLTDISLGSDVTVGDITFNGNYHLSNDTITLNGNITSNSSEILFQSSLLLAHDTTITTNTSDGLILYAIADGGDNYGITKQGAGTLSLVQNSTYTGATVVTSGTLDDNLALDSIITVDTGATLDAPTGVGAPGGIIGDGGTVELGQNGSPGQLTVSGSISLGGGSTFQEDIFDDSINSEQDGILVATGVSTSIDLTGSTLAVSLQGDAIPSPGDVVTLISNQHSNRITGTFNGLPQNAITEFNGVYYQISYSDGSGGDVSLTVVDQPIPSKVVFDVQPASATAGHSIGTVAVDVEDQFGNLIASDSSSTVTLTGAGLTGTSSLMVTNGIATFTGLSMTTAGLHSLNAADGDLTFATSNSITISPAAANKLAFTQQPTGAVAGASIGTVVVDVEDQYGNIVTTDSSSTVTLAGTSLTGPLTATATASSGIATFSGLAMNQSGSRTVTATDSDLTSATSNSITITPASASQLVFTTQPHGAVAGATIGSIVIDVEDRYGNVVTIDSSSTVTLTGTSLTGALTVTSSSGIATFSGLAMNQSGSRTLTATDGGLTSATSNSITITPATASQLVFTTQPHGAVAGATIGTAVVDVEDQYGNIVTTDSPSTVTLTGTSLTGVPTATASSGIATFSGLAMNQSGSRSLTATDGSLTSATSNSITITPATASQLVFTTQPHGAVAGATIGSVVVDVEDQYGNIVTTDSSSTVTLTGTLTANVSNGVATFTGLFMTQSGSYVLTATDGDLTSANSSSITITPASASNLVFSTQPHGATAGATIGSVVVDIEDQYGNVVTTDSSSIVTLTGTSLTGILTATASSGVATFSGLAMNQSGSRVLTATDGSLTLSNSSSITITPASASQLAFTTQPHGAFAGASIGSIVVNVEDSYGNFIASDSSSTVTLTGTSLTGTLTATVSSGVATFGGLAMTQSGSRTLVATDGELTSATSGSITISAATANHLVFSTPPNSAIAGASIGAIVVSVEDRYGNVVTTDSASTVTLSGAPLNGNTSVTVTNGVASFGLISATLAGSNVLSARDGTLTPATCNPITITPASAAQLVFAQPILAVATGHAMPPVAIEIEDAFGNVVTIDGSLVTLSGEVLLGGPASVAAVNGIAVFPNLRASGPVEFTLTAARSGLSSVTSNPIDFSTDAAWISSATDFLGNNGEMPLSTLISDSNGDFYGTTASDERSGYGTIFRVHGGAIQTLAYLNASTGGSPLAGLVMDSSGNLFGTTTSSGAYGNGSVFELSSGGVLSVVAPFNGSYSSGSESPLLIDAHGNLFGETETGGTHGDGTVFEIPDFGSGLTTLADFDSTDSSPQGGLDMDSAGNLYGTTNDGSGGTVFEIAASGHALTTLQTFTGAGPRGRLAMDSAGSLYGTTEVGGINAEGTVFKISTADDALTTIAAFNGTNGANPNSGVILDATGNLFGTTSYGVTEQGTVFEIPAGTGTINTLVTFDGNNASNINTGVVMDSTGDLWGVGSGGGDNDDGTIYEVQRQGHAQITSAPTTITVGASQALTVSLKNAEGAVDTGNESTVTLSIASGPDGAALGGELTVTAVDGVATFPGITFPRPGTYTLSAISGGLASFASTNITVTAGAANHLALIQPPASATAGDGIGTVVVDVEDQYGNLATGDNSAVTLAGTNLTAVTVDANHGVATFTGLVIDRAGVSTLTATDGGLASVTSILITISPAAAAKLVFAQQPTVGTEDQNLGNIAVNIEDAFGNLVTTDWSTVTLSANDGPPLGGNPSEVAAGGVAIFSNVSILGFGSQVLSATDGNLVGATTSPIAVTAALASLLITAPATTADQGTSVQLQITGANPSGTAIALTGVVWSLDAGSTGSINQAGLFTAGNAIGIAIVRATCEAQTATFAITVNGSPVIAISPYVQQIASASNTATLHVQGQQAGSNTSLIYTWSIISQPATVSGRLNVGSSALAVFSVNGTTSAANTSVTFLASGSYTLQVTASDGIQSVSSDVQVTATVKSSIAKTQALTTQVSGVSTIGNTQQITGFVITFNGPLDAATAQSIRSYRIHRLIGGSVMPQSAVYDPATYSVTLTLAKPMLIQRGTGKVQVMGSGAYAIRDAQGHLIDGDSNGTPGGSFVWSFSMQLAKTVIYRTVAGDLVTLILTGPGKIISLLPTGSSAPIITLTGTSAVSSLLTGKFRKGRTSVGYAVLDQLNGTSLAKVQLGEEFHVNQYNAEDVQG